MERPVTDAGRPRAGALLLAVAYVGFVSLGLPDPVAGVAWPSVRGQFGLPQSGFGLVFLALGVGYCASGFFGGQLTRLLGLGNLLWLSSAFVAAAMFGSGLAPAWWAYVLWAVVWGLGSGGIDAGLNAHVSAHFSARHVNWLHACYSFGATLGPLAMTALLVSSGSWRPGYLLVGGALAVMTLLFVLTRRRWDGPAGDPSAAPGGMSAALREPLVWLQAALFFVYVGLEFTAGQWCFTLLTESRGIRADVAGWLTGGYFAAIGVGRVLSGAVTARVGVDRLVRVCLLGVLAGAALFAVPSPAAAGCAGLLVMGLGLAPVFPCLMARTPERLGPAHAAHAVGFQVSAGMLGAATVPGLAGLLAGAAGLEAVTWFVGVLAVVLSAAHELLLRASRGRA